MDMYEPTIADDAFDDNIIVIGNKFGKFTVQKGQEDCQESEGTSDGKNKTITVVCSVIGSVVGFFIIGVLCDMWKQGKCYCDCGCCCYGCTGDYELDSEYGDIFPYKEKIIHPIYPSKIKERQRPYEDNYGIAYDALIYKKSKHK